MSLRAWTASRTQALLVQVEGCPVDVAGWRVHHPDAVPALEGSRHGLLREVLRLRGFPREQVARPGELRILGPEEDFEVKLRGPSVERPQFRGFEHSRAP
jgi:hypothetical protein